MCKAKIGALETTNGWCYISCAKCSKKLQRGVSSFTCTTCFNANVVGVVRYRVEMLVDSGEHTAVFVAFDSAMSKLTGVRAAEVANPMGEGVQDPSSYQLPQFLQDIVGNTYVFHLKLTEFIFSGNHKSFTVARIFDLNDRLPAPSFAPYGGGNNPDDDKHGNKCALQLGCSSGSNPSGGGCEELKASSADGGTPASTEQHDAICEGVHENAVRKCAGDQFLRETQNLRERENTHKIVNGVRPILPTSPDLLQIFY